MKLHTTGLAALSLAIALGLSACGGDKQAAQQPAAVAQWGQPRMAANPFAQRRATPLAAAVSPPSPSALPALPPTEADDTLRRTLLLATTIFIIRYGHHRFPYPPEE